MSSPKDESKRTVTTLVSLRNTLACSNAHKVSFNQKYSSTLSKTRFKNINITLDNPQNTIPIMEIEVPITKKIFVFKMVLQHTLLVLKL